MNQEVKALWVNALRSGDYRQTEEGLSDVSVLGEFKHCCLGVLCEVAVEQNPDIAAPGMFVGDDGRVWKTYDDKEAVLPLSIIEWSGISDCEGSVDDVDVDGLFLNVTLAELNDVYGFNFEQIADIIEEKF